MSAQTNIEWCDSTFNAWEGCTKVGPGCDHCYAETRNGRFHAGANWGPGAPRLVRSDSYWREPLKWERDHEAFFAEHGRRRRVFCSSLSDVFDNEAPEGQRERLWELIKATPHLDWLLLTKRIGNAKRMLPADWADGWHNVRIGATMVDQSEYDRDIDKLKDLPAASRFISAEPLLARISMELSDGLIHQVIVGGESGHGARPMHQDWVANLRDQCAAASVPFLFKQWGEWTPGVNVDGTTDTVDTAHWFGGSWSFGRENLASFSGHVDDEPDLYRVGKKAAGRLLDGVQHDGYPEAQL